MVRNEAEQVIERFVAAWEPGAEDELAHTSPTTQYDTRCP